MQVDRCNQFAQITCRGVIAVIQPRRISKKGVRHPDGGGAFIHFGDKRLSSARIGAGKSGGRTIVT